MRYGYTLMTEQAGPTDLVRHARAAEQAGFAFAVCSDHFSPWLAEQGHAPYAWSVLGAVTQCTERMDLMSYVTCPLLRYHPAVVAQKAATVALLSGDRFTLGLGAGENLNEHIVGSGWPPVQVRHAMLTEAIDIISRLLDGETVNHRGTYYQVDAAKLWDLPQRRVPIAVAVSGPRSVARYAPVADTMIAVDPAPDIAAVWDDLNGHTARKVGQLPICWDTDRDAAIRRAREQFRWFAGGWKVNAELPDPAAFDAATRFVTEQDVADAIPCGTDIGAVLDRAAAFAKAGFTDLALVQIGGDHQDTFLDAAHQELVAALEEAG